MELLGSLHQYGSPGSWRVAYGDEAAGTYDVKTFTLTEYGSRAKAEAIKWQKSKQPKWNKIVADRAKALVAKYNSLIKEMSADGRVPNKPFDKLSNTDKASVKTELYRKGQLKSWEVLSDVVIGKEKFRIPTSLLRQKGMDNYKNAIKLLQKWKKNPTVENLADLTLKADQGTGQVLRDFKKYLKGESFGYGARKGIGGGQTTKIIESFDLNKLLGKDADVFKTANIQKISASKNLKKILDTFDPYKRGTNDFEPIIKIINKYKWNNDLTDFQNRGNIIKEIKSNPIIKDRFKRMGEEFNNTNIIKRANWAHKRILQDSFSDIESQSLKNLNESQLQNYLRNAQNYFPQVNRALSQTILETLKGDDLKKAKEKLKIYGKLRTYLNKQFTNAGGALSKSFLQFDHPLSLATLKKTGNVAASLNVNPIQGDLNIWKRELDLRLNALTKIDEKTGRLNPKNIEPLKALNNANKVLFGKLGGDFTVTDEGIKIKSFGADPFLKTDLVKGLEKNIGLRGELIKSFDTIDKSTWDKIGIKDAGVFRDRLRATADINVGDFKEGLLKWTQENPKWTKILKGSVGCLRRASADGGRINFQAGGDPSDVCLINKIENEPNRIVRAFRSLPGAGKIGAIGAALGKFGKFGAIAAAGAATAGLVKTFMNDDPTTYLSNEDQQKNMLISMVTNPIDDTPEESPEILDYQLPTLGAVTAAGMIPGGKRVYDVRRRGGPNLKPAGPVRSALGLKGVLGKGLAATATPLGLAALEPLHIAGQVAQGDSLTDIGTNPLNYLGAAFASPLTKEATRFASPMASKIIRMGMSPAALKGLSRFGGYGLAASLGIQGLQKFDDWRNKRGWFSREDTYGKGSGF